MKEYKSELYQKYRAKIIQCNVLKLVVILFALLSIISTYKSMQSSIVLYPVSPNNAVSISQWQEYLTVADYYKGDIDGKLGELTEDAWDRWYCDKMALRTFE